MMKNELEKLVSKMNNQNNPNPYNMHGYTGTIPKLVNEDQKDTVPSSSNWQGDLTIRDLLEKIDLTTYNYGNNQSQSNNLKGYYPSRGYHQAHRCIPPNGPYEDAFLGPKLWDKPLENLGDVMPSPSSNKDLQFSVMNIDDFLKENNLYTEQNNACKTQPPPSSYQTTSVNSSQSRAPSRLNSTCEPHGAPPPMPKREENEKVDTTISSSGSESDDSAPKGEVHPRKRSYYDFDSAEISLATIPGSNFDPTNRYFTPDELKPQPIIRKRKKTFVDAKDKDAKYWERRTKNNVAAKRSREARRLKENQIALRTAFLEGNNDTLRKALDKVKCKNERLTKENEMLKKKLSKYEDVPGDYFKFDSGADGSTSNSAKMDSMQA